jgi:hypothetical protein
MPAYRNIASVFIIGRGSLQDSGARFLERARVPIIWRHIAGAVSPLSRILAPESWRGCPRIGICHHHFMIERGPLQDSGARFLERARVPVIIWRHIAGEVSPLSKNLASESWRE